MSHPNSHDHEQSRSRKSYQKEREGRAADLDWGQAVSTRVAVPAIACSARCVTACGRGMRPRAHGMRGHCESGV